MFGRAVVVWLFIAVLAILNGGLREAVIVPRAGSQAGHVMSTFLLGGIILLVTWMLTDWIGFRSIREALLVGTVWVVLTLAFEFLAGHYVFGNPWEKLLADYNVLRGRVWVLVPITTFLAPVLTLSLRR